MTHHSIEQWKSTKFVKNCLFFDVKEQILAIFPLEIVVFPTEKLNLHIFEPRYKQLIQDCKESGMHFGIPPVFDNALKPLMTEMRLEKIEKTYDDGKLDIRTRAVGLWAISGKPFETSGKLYSSVNAKEARWDAAGNIHKNIEILKLVRKLYKSFRIKKHLPDKTKMPLSPEIGHHIGLTREQEYALLSIPGEEGRQDFILNHLETLVPIAKEIEAMQKKVKMNGHFREFPRLDL